jgi:hypothetical protein
LRQRPDNNIQTSSTTIAASGAKCTSWGGKWAGIKDGFANIRVKDLRSGVSKRISEYCRGKVCVIDFWMTKHGGSPFVSMDA